MAETSEPTVQMPMSASATPGSAVPSSGAKNNANAGRATTSAATRKASVAIALPSQIALRSQGASTSPSSAAVFAFGHPGSTEPEQRREDERDPEQPVRRVVAGVGRKREVEDDER